jgi:hypothetical protein
VTEMEQWRRVPGHKGWYEVSDQGRVRSTRSRRTRVLKPVVDFAGRHVVTLCGSRPKRKVRVAVLVAEVFLGPRPEGMQVCHNDGNKLDNRLANLRYDTRLGNDRDRILHGTSNRGETNVHAKLTEAEVREIRRWRSGGTPTAVLADAYGVAQRTVRDIVNGTTWGWLA